MSAVDSNPYENPCPDCGEMVRINSLRCWNCGAFMNKDVELKYMQMQANPKTPLYSELPEGAAVSYEASDDDFELSVPMSTPSDTAPAPTESPAEGGEPAGQAPAESSGAGEGDDVAHSVATGGDALLDIAMQEESESRQRRKGRRRTGGMRTPGGGLIIFCPYGCRIEVKEQHRGMTGRCPQCRAPFVVPVDPPNFKSEVEETAGTEAKSGGFDPWLIDLNLHSVNPEKLKLKANSLAKEFSPADFGFSDEQLLVALLPKKSGGLFGGEKGTPRDAMLEHLKAGKSLDELPVASKHLFSTADLSQLKVVQPTANRADSIFHGIPVFGEGRIAIQLPITEESSDALYVSLGLTQFWDFAKAIEDHFGITGLGAGCGIPPEHVYTNYRCHYTDTPIKALENLEYYNADPTVELALAGYRCGACGLAVCEEGRKKEALGGKAGKGIAKAKCPKCGSKMGDNPLNTLKEEVEEPSMDG